MHTPARARHLVSVGPATGAASLACAALDPLRAVRRPPDPHSLMTVCLDGVPASEAALRIAGTLAQAVGDAVVDERFISPLAYIPESNLAAFKRRGGQILFAASYLAAVDDDVANVRRGYPLTPAQRDVYAAFDEPHPPVHGLYDPELDALIFSTAVPPIDHERLVLHEFGHAMTYLAWYAVAHARTDLLLGLPRQMNDLLERYPAGTSPEAIRVRVLEALAEAYAWTIVGRYAELPERLARIAHATLSERQLRSTG